MAGYSGTVWAYEDLSMPGRSVTQPRSEPDVRLRATQRNWESLPQTWIEYRGHFLPQAATLHTAPHLWTQSTSCQCQARVFSGPHLPAWPGRPLAVLPCVVRLSGYTYVYMSSFTRMRTYSRSHSQLSCPEVALVKKPELGLGSCRQHPAAAEEKERSQWRETISAAFCGKK